MKALFKIIGVLGLITISIYVSWQVGGYLGFFFRPILWSEEELKYIERNPTPVEKFLIDLRPDNLGKP